MTERGTEFAVQVRGRVQEAYDRVMASREAILEAFMAETGLRPSEIEQVQVNEPDCVRWYVRRRVDAGV